MESGRDEKRKNPMARKVLLLLCELLICDHSIKVKRNEFRIKKNEACVEHPILLIRIS